MDGGVVALGAAFAVSAAGATWRAASLRSEIVSNYRGRVALAQAALDEKAATALRALALRVDEVLGDLEQFDPHQAVGDPSELLAHVKTVDAVLTARKKLPAYFRRMLRVGPFLTALFAAIVVGDLVALSYFSGWNRARLVGLCGLWSCGALLAAVATVGVWYVTLLHRFSGAEILGFGEDDG